MQVLLRQQMMLVKILVTYLKLSLMSTGLLWRISPLETKFLSWISSPSKFSSTLLTSFTCYAHEWLETIEFHYNCWLP